jgi:hypothetical protein
MVSIEPQRHLKERRGRKMSELSNTKDVKIELYNDHFENAKRYGIPHAQLIIATSRDDRL